MTITEFLRNCLENKDQEVPKLGKEKQDSFLVKGNFSFKGMITYHCQYGPSCVDL